MLTHAQLKWLIEEADLNEPIILSHERDDRINDEPVSLTINDNDLKLQFLPFIFAFAQDLQEVQDDTITCFINLEQKCHFEKEISLSLKLGRPYKDKKTIKKCLRRNDYNWENLLDFLKDQKNKSKNKDIADFYFSLLENKKEIRCVFIDFAERRKS